ncbi:MAG: lipocalin-like domain-containing protein [Rubrivivax sp.]
MRRGRPLVFPRDHGAHPGTRIEWWYLTGWLRQAGDAALLGFQLTFFRVRTGLAESLPGRLAPRQLLFAHAAITDLARGRHHHAEHLARWNGQWHDDPATVNQASLVHRDVRLGPWHLDARQARVRTARLELELQLAPTQPILLQGERGYSRKGPGPTQASHYYSEPHIAVQGELAFEGTRRSGSGRAWLDHEWSDEILHPQAVGWDWIGINLEDGRALTAFRLRRADGSVLWAGGSVRGPGAPGGTGASGASGASVRDFSPDEVVFEPGRTWKSPATQALYPVAWTVRTPAGTFGVRSLLDAQEIDARRSTGTVYWEGLSELLDAQGRRLGLGYLEMTGYAGRLRL